MVVSHVAERSGDRFDANAATQRDDGTPLRCVPYYEQEGISLEEMLEALDQERETYCQEHYGR